MTPSRQHPYGWYMANCCLASRSRPGRAGPRLGADGRHGSRQRGGRSHRHSGERVFATDELVMGDGLEQDVEYGEYYLAECGPTGRCRCDVLSRAALRRWRAAPARYPGSALVVLDGNHPRTQRGAGAWPRAGAARDASGACRRGGAKAAGVAAKCEAARAAQRAERRRGRNRIANERVLARPRPLMGSSSRLALVKW